MSMKTTQELELYVKNLYHKLKPFAEKEHIFKPIMFHFSETDFYKMPGDFCYSDGVFYYYVGVGDRGAFSIEKTKSLFEITYWIFNYQTMSMAYDYEKKNRVAGKDPRRIAFSKQLELMKILGENYEQKARSEINSILSQYPFQDELFSNECNI